jgi:hypothetical protein
MFEVSVIVHNRAFSPVLFTLLIAGKASKMMDRDAINNFL